MRILLDECVHAGLKKAFPDDAVKTVPEAGWSGIKNGKLLALIAGQFDVFLTIDQNIRFQQNLSGLSFAILFISVPNNMMVSYLPLLASIRVAAHKLRPGEMTLIP
jgi:ABC-type siderophore export system fused ATPase/permease subunit